MQEPSRSASRIAQWGILLFCLFAILWHGGKTLESTWMLGMLAGIVGALSWWTGVHKERGEGTRPSQISWTQHGRISPVVWGIAMLFGAWTITSFIFSLTRNYGLDEVLRDVSCIILFFWMIRTAAPSFASQPVPVTGNQRLSFPSRLIATIAVGTLLACVIGVAIYVYQPVNRFVGTFVDPRFTTDYWPNAWADYLLLAWPCVYAWTRKMRIWWHAPLLGLVIGSLFLSYSRGAILALAAQLLLLGILFAAVSFVRARRTGVLHWHVRALRRRAQRAVGIVLVALCMFFAVNTLRAERFSVQSVGEKATFTAAEGSSSVTERDAFWHQSLQLSLERPLFGWGPYSFRFIQPRLQTSVFATSDHPHNVFLKLAMERGWPAAILFALLILGILFATAWREMKQRTSLLPAAMVDDDADLCLPVFLALSGVLLHSMIDYNLQFVAIAVPFWLLLGFLAARMSRIPAIGREPTVIRVTEIGLIALLLCMLLFEGRYLVLSSLGRKAETSQAPDQALHWYTLARGELFSRDLHLSRASLLAEQDDLQGASSAIADYMLQNREDARAWKLLGDIQYRQESYAKALASYDRAFVLGKYNYLGILTGTLQTLLAHPDPAQNAARKQETDTILHAFASAVMQDAHFIDLSTNIEEFSTAASLAAKLYPAEMQSYHLLKTQVMEKATAERARLGNQRQGMLW